MGNSTTRRTSGPPFFVNITARYVAATLSSSLYEFMVNEFHQARAFVLEAMVDLS
jgi:hypothetical protein